MLILAIDTSGKSGGISLAEGDQQSFRLLGSSPIAGGTFSAQLVPTIASLLETQGRSLKQLGGFVVVSGPGSFTGLRVGLSAVKGLAEILGKPIATVSLLEALAIAGGEGEIAAALDAGRSGVFFGLYRISVNKEDKISEELISQGQFLERIGAPEIAAVVTSDESIVALGRSDEEKAKIKLLSRPDSALIARIGLKKLLNGDSVSVEALDANYIRRSDAEIFSRGGR